MQRNCPSQLQATFQPLFKKLHRATSTTSILTPLSHSNPMTTSTATINPIFLVVGSKGWIGGMLVEMLKESKQAVYASVARIEDRAALAAYVSKYNAKV